MKRFSPKIVLGLGPLLALFRIAASPDEYVSFIPLARAAVSILGSAGTAAVAVGLSFVLAPRSDWRDAVFFHAAAVQALAVLLRLGARLSLTPQAVGGALPWIIAVVLAVLSGAVFGAVLVAFAWALRRFDFVREEADAPAA